jgi:hypothetical protein
MRKAKEILRNVLKINGEITEKDYKLKVSVEDALKAINTALTIDVVVKSDCDKVDLSLVLSEHHKYILENGYTRNYIDTDLVAFEFMGMDYDDQKISKN